MVGVYLTKILGQNWKTTLAAIAAFAVSVPAVVTAIEQWSHHQPVDWRSAVVGLVLAVGLAVAKDASTHSTAEQVESATVKAQLDAKKP